MKIIDDGEQSYKAIKSAQELEAKKQSRFMVGFSVFLLVVNPALLHPNRQKLLGIHKQIVRSRGDVKILVNVRISVHFEQTPLGKSAE